MILRMLQEFNHHCGIDGPATEGLAESRETRLDAAAEDLENALLLE